MAGEQAIPIPQGLNLCGSVADLTLFTQLLNYNFQLVIQLAEDNQGITVTLPGLPFYTIPGASWDVPIDRVGLDTSWIGGRFPIGFPWAKGSAHGEIADQAIPGTNPLSLLLMQTNYNFQLIYDAIPDVQDVLMSVPAFTTNICSLPPSAQPAATAAVVNQINQQLSNVVGVLNTASCVAVNPADFSSYGVNSGAGTVGPGVCYALTGAWGMGTEGDTTLTPLTNGFKVESAGINANFGSQLNGYHNTAFVGDPAPCKVELGTGCAGTTMTLDFDLNIPATSPLFFVDARVITITRLDSTGAFINTATVFSDGGFLASSAPTGHFSVSFGVGPITKYVAFSVILKASLNLATDAGALTVENLTLNP